MPQFTNNDRRKGNIGIADARTITAQDRGWLVARLLAGSWRQKPEPAELTQAQLAAIHPIILSSGAAALAWRRVSSTPLADTPQGVELREAYRNQVLETALHESQIREAVACVRAANVEPLLIKGLSTAKYYPEAWLRTPRDIDLAVLPAEYDRAKESLAATKACHLWVDLHEGLQKLGIGRSDEEVFSAAGDMEIEDVRVRILSPEDHLRMQCMHLIIHGALRPIWLCDIAAMAENLPADFDGRCFWRTDAQRFRWIQAALGLARDLLDAQLDDSLGGSDIPPAPQWLSSYIVRRWGNLLDIIRREQTMIAMSRLVRQPWRIYGGLQARQRWPEAMATALQFGRDLHHPPSLTCKLASLLLRMIWFLKGQEPTPVALLKKQAKIIVNDANLGGNHE